MYMQLCTHVSLHHENVVVVADGQKRTIVQNRPQNAISGKSKKKK